MTVGLEPAVPRDSTRSDLRSLGRGTSLNLAGSVVAGVLNVVVPVIVTRGFTRADAGTFFAATALFTIFINVGTVGADTGILRSLPRARALGQQAEMRTQLRVALVPPALFSAVLAAGLVVLAPQIAGWVSGRRSGSEQLFVHFLHVLGPLLPVAVLYVTAMSATRGFGALKPLVLLEKVGRGSLQAALIALCVLLAPTATLLIVAWSVPYLAAGVVLALWLRALLRAAVSRRAEDAPPSRPVRVVAREFWAFSAPRALSRIFNVALQRFDIILVAALLGPAQAAVYTAATRFLLLGLLFVQAIQQVMAPKISEFLAQDDRGRSTLLYRTTTSWLTLVSWPLYLMSALFAPVLLRIFGEGYERGATVVLVLCLTMLVATTCGPVDSILLMAGRSSWSLYNTAAALAVNVGLDLVLIPRLGINGAALGWTAGILVANLVPLAQVHRSLGMHPFGDATLRVMVLAGLCFGVLPLLVRLALGATVPGLLVASVVATAAYAGLLLHSRRALELDALTAALRRPRGVRRTRRPA